MKLLLSITQFMGEKTHVHLHKTAGEAQKQVADYCRARWHKRFANDNIPVIGLSDVEVLKKFFEGEPFANSQVMDVRINFDQANAVREDNGNYVVRLGTREVKAGLNRQQAELGVQLLNEVLQ